MITKEQQQKIHDKFLTDPDWKIVEEMLLEYLEPLRDINSIDLTGTSDSVMAEVAGRVKAYNGITKFLRDCRILGQITGNSANNFK